MAYQNDAVTHILDSLRFMMYLCSYVASKMTPEHIKDEAMSEILVPAEVAPMLKTTVQGLAQKRYLGRGPKFIKHGSRVLYRRSDVEDYLAANTRTSTGARSGAA